ncbi:MAG: DUF6268 family outer membrane beta-barrel protein [Bacteroidota bacterium]
MKHRSKYTLCSCFFYGLFIICSLSICLSAQNLDLAGFSYTRLPSADVVDSPSNQRAETNELNAFLNIPIPLRNKKTILIHGLQYRRVAPVVENDRNGTIDGQTLHLASYRFMLVHKLKSDWTAMFIVNPTLSSTFNTPLERDDVIGNGVIQFMRRPSDHFSYGFGVARTARFGEVLIIPTFQLTKDYQHSTLQVFLPRQISFDYHFRTFDLGVQFSLSGSEYNANYTVMDASNNEVSVDKLAYSRILLGPTFSYPINDLLRFDAFGGVVANRRIELIGGSGVDETLEVESAPFFQIGISLGLPQR